MFYNDFEISQAIRKHNPNTRPNLAILAHTLDALKEWADNNSDGWAHWPKPSRAAAKAGRTLWEFDTRTWASHGASQEDDITDAERKAALTPIKAFLTRQGVAHDEIIARIVRV